jgi:glycerol-1-phosphatase
MMLADGYDAFLFDLDGVLYRGPAPVPHAAESVAHLRSMGKGVAFVTNNSSRTPDAVADTLVSVGVPARPAEVETSALTTAAMLVNRGMRTAFVVGEEGVRSALAQSDIEVVDGTPAAVEAVVVGLDRAADYDKLRVASVLVAGGAALIATNGDASFPADDGPPWPGAGALLAVVETTTGRRAEVIGKPHAPIMLAALDRAGGGRPLVIGDRLDTDIAGAQALGWDSLLVLTGIATRAQLETSPIRPTHVADDLRALFAGTADAESAPGARR